MIDKDTIKQLIIKNFISRKYL